jgi:hypothetical protein
MIKWPFIIILAVSIPLFSADTHYYVSTAGSDSNPGSSELPFASIQHAIDVCSEIDPYYIHLDVSTWIESPSALNERITINGDYDGPNGQGGRESSIILGLLTLRAQNYNKDLWNVSVTSLSLAAIAANMASKVVTVNNCNIHGGENGVVFYTNGFTAQIHIDNCSIYNCTSSGISGNGNRCPDIANCNIHDNGTGINVVLSTSGNGQCQHNEIYNNVVGISVTASGYIFAYNNIYNNISYGVYSLAGYPDFGSVGHNSFVNNGDYDFYNTSASDIPAQYNYWDCRSVQQMAGHNHLNFNVTRIWDKWDDPSVGYVIWDNPLSSTKVQPTSLGLIKAVYSLSNSPARSHARKIEKARQASLIIVVNKPYP